MKSSDITAYTLLNAFYAVAVNHKLPSSDIATYSMALMHWNICKRPLKFRITRTEFSALTGLKPSTLSDSLKRLCSRNQLHIITEKGLAGYTISMTRPDEWHFSDQLAEHLKKVSNTRTRDTSENKLSENQAYARKADEKPIIEVVTEKSTQETSKYYGLTLEQMLALRRAEKADN